MQGFLLICKQVSISRFASGHIVLDKLVSQFQLFYESVWCLQQEAQATTLPSLYTALVLFTVHWGNLLNCSASLFCLSATLVLLHLGILFWRVSDCEVLLETLDNFCVLYEDTVKLLGTVWHFSVWLALSIYPSGKNRAVYRDNFSTRETIPFWIFYSIFQILWGFPTIAG